MDIFDTYLIMIDYGVVHGSTMAVERNLISMKLVLIH